MQKFNRVQTERMRTTRRLFRFEYKKIIDANGIKEWQISHDQYCPCCDTTHKTGI